MSEQNPQYSSNPVLSAFEHLGHAAHIVEHAIVHDTVEIVEFPERLLAVLKVGKAAYPKIHADLVLIESTGQTAFVDGVQAIAAKGLNWQEDVATVQAIEAFSAAWKPFVADVEAAYAEIKSAAAGAASVAVASTTL